MEQDHTRSWFILREDISVLTLKFQEDVNMENTRMDEWKHKCGENGISCKILQPLLYYRISWGP